MLTATVLAAIITIGSESLVFSSPETVIRIIESF